MRVLALFGPTAVGKTQIAIAAAQLLRRGGEDPVAVSADALQVYRGLEILTGAPSDGERRALEHRLVGFLAVQETFSVGRYAQLAHAEIDDAARRRASADRRRRHRPVPARGARRPRSAPTAAGTPARRADSTAGARGGAARFTDSWQSAAPWAAARIEPADGRRIVRALELRGDRRAARAKRRVRTVERGVASPDASFALAARSRRAA